MLGTMMRRNSALSSAALSHGRSHWWWRCDFNKLQRLSLDKVSSITTLIDDHWCKCLSCCPCFGSSQTALQTWFSQGKRTYCGVKLFGFAWSSVKGFWDSHVDLFIGSWGRCWICSHSRFSGLYGTDVLASQWHSKLSTMNQVGFEDLMCWGSWHLDILVRMYIVV